MSESSSSNTTSPTTNNIDNRQINDASGGGFINQGNFNQSNTNFYQTTDWGAVAAGKDIATTSLSMARETTSKALDTAVLLQQQSFNASGKVTAEAMNFAKSSQAAASGSLSQALAAVMKAYDGAKGDANASSKVMQVAVGGVIVVAAAAIIFRK